MDFLAVATSYTVSTTSIHMMNIFQNHGSLFDARVSYTHVRSLRWPRSKQTDPSVGRVALSKIQASSLSLGWDM